MLLQHCVDIRAMQLKTGVVVPLSRKGTRVCVPSTGGREGVFHLLGDHSPQSPWERLLQVAGEESPAALWIQEKKRKE